MNKYTIITERGTQCSVVGTEIYEAVLAHDLIFFVILKDVGDMKKEVLRTPITSTIITNELKNGNAGQ